MSNTLITIRPGLPVVMQEWPADRLECGAPPFADMRLLIGSTCRTIEHVSVLYQGKPAHMFVDEDGLFKRLSFNHKASAIYTNATARRLSAPTYDNVLDEPHWKVDDLMMNNLVIVGTALLWLGDLK